MFNEAIESSDPRSIFEKSEEIDAELLEERFAFGRMLGWILDARTLAVAGFRAHLVAYKIRPDLIDGASLDAISRRLGYGRSASHKLSKELTRIFGVRGLNDRSERACRAYAAAWRACRRKPELSDASNDTTGDERTRAADNQSRGRRAARNRRS